MAQMYLVEIFVDKVTVYPPENDTSADKRLIVLVKFGPKEQFIIREGAMVDNQLKDDIQEVNAMGKLTWSRVIRVGRSFLFPSYPDSMALLLKNFPLEIEVWNDDEFEPKDFIGVGLMMWDKEFFHMLRESTVLCEKTEPLTIKQNILIYAECCCAACGEVDFILRVSVMGQSITTEFQQPMSNPNKFLFRTDRFPSVFQCQQVEEGDPNFAIVGSLYESTSLEKPTFKPDKVVEICTDVDSCAIGTSKGPKAVCRTSKKDLEPKQYPIKKIKMGDIAGPCGNTNCALAHKIKMYLRNLDAYKSAASKVPPSKQNVTKNVCGKCVCKDDRWHRDQCPGNDVVRPKLCHPCGGVTSVGMTCDETTTKLYRPRNPEDIDKDVRYVLSVPNFPTYSNVVFGENDYIVQCSQCKNGNATHSCNSKRIDFSYVDFKEYDTSFPGTSDILVTPSTPNLDSYDESSCCPCRRYDSRVTTVYTASQSEVNQAPLQTKTMNQSQQFSIYNCTTEQFDKDCQCATTAPRLPPPCRSADCECREKAYSKMSRKTHKPFCPCYVHKEMCPVTRDIEEEDGDDEEEAESLPYGLPPVKLGPCPVMGRPCTVPDGFARMYRTALLQPLPPSQGEVGKVCCSKEFERIKKALKDYMKHEKENDSRCINKFNVDTERRCCDKEQNLFPLIGQSCCGTHKLAIQDKFNEKK